jgi:hypothetical protein
MNFFEYGIMKEMVKESGKHILFVHDPVDDDPNEDWNDYRDYYFRTVTASLLHPQVCHFELC